MNITLYLNDTFRKIDFSLYYILYIIWLNKNFRKMIYIIQQSTYRKKTLHNSNFQLLSCGIQFEHCLITAVSSYIVIKMSNVKCLNLWTVNLTKLMCI